MARKLYVGNLAYTLGEEELRAAFAEVGEVVSVAIVKDRATGQSRGFGFVEMVTEDDAKNAIATLHGRPLGSRTIVVSEARPHQPRDPRPRPGGRPSDGAPR
ncbi:MAG: RNA recognition motif domain-containing protein [Candidatus Binatia bacterium]